MPRRRRRLGRILLNALTVLSLLLCVGTVGLWVRSHWFDDLWEWRPGPRRLSLRSVAGETEFRWPARQRDSLEPRPTRVGLGDFDLNNVGTPSGRYFRTVPGPVAATASRLLGNVGVEFNANALPMRSHHWPVPREVMFRGLLFRTHRLLMPHWLATLATLALPALSFGSWRRRRRRTVTPGLCPRCHYDLSGNVSGVCPECGTRIGSTS